jgi:hypothetical protein
VEVREPKPTNPVILFKGRWCKRPEMLLDQRRELSSKLCTVSILGLEFVNDVTVSVPSFVYPSEDRGSRSRFEWNCNGRLFFEAGVPGSRNAPCAFGGIVGGKGEKEGMDFRREASLEIHYLSQDFEAMRPRVCSASW